MAAKIANEEVDPLYQKLHRAAEKFGYHLNPDMEFTRDLLKGLLVNKNRYGYMACPCRLASGNRTEDKDIICPCDYRDQDLNEYGNCYCALYVSEDIADGKKEAISIPERRPQKEMQKQEMPPSHVSSSTTSKLTYPVWRCKVCGYLCARDEPPERCPVCRADKDRFEQFM
jgi:ferredoxin-thioredoxin reductase catalytic subunit